MKLLMLLGLIFLAGSCNARPIVNGGFDQGFSGWNDISSQGFVNVDADGALLLSGGLGSAPYAASASQGDDGSFLFANPLSLSPGDQFLSFDVFLGAQTTDSTESGTSFFSDFLSVELYDSLDFSYDLFFQSGSDFSIDSQSSTVFLDLSPLQGREFALTVNLFDEDDGLNAIFGVDKFAFTEMDSPGDAIEVPEPGTSGLMLLSLSVLLLRRRACIQA